MATIYSNGTGGGNWSSGSSWQGGAVPTSSDDVIIQVGDTILLDVNVAVNSIWINGVLNISTYSINSPTFTVASGGVVQTSTGTITAATSLEIHGTLGTANTAYILSCGALSIFSDGTFNAPNSSGSCTISGNLSYYVGGTFNHNNGTITLNAASNNIDISGSMTFWNLTAQGSYQTKFNNSTNVQNVLTFSGAGWKTLANGVELTIGHSGNAGSFSNSCSNAFRTNEANAIFTVQGYLSTTRTPCTGSNWYFGADAQNVVLKTKNLDFQFNISTVGGNNNYTWEIIDNVKVGWVYINGQDTWKCTTPGAVIDGGSSGSAQVIYGKIYFEGTSANPLQLGKNTIWGGLNVAGNNSSIYLKYVNMKSYYAAFAFGYPAQVAGYNQIVIENNSFTTYTTGDPSIHMYNCTVPITIKDSIITSATGAQISIYFYLNGKLQFENTIYNKSVKFYGGGNNRWFVNKKSNGDFDVYGQFNSEDPDAGFKGSNCTGILTVKQPDIMTNSFNSTYTLGANISPSGLVITANTIFNSNGYSINCSTFSADGTVNITSASTLTTNSTFSIGTAANVSIASTMWNAKGNITLEGAAIFNHTNTVNLVGDLTIIDNGQHKFDKIQINPGYSLTANYLEFQNSVTPKTQMHLYDSNSKIKCKNSQSYPIPNEVIFGDMPSWTTFANYPLSSSFNLDNGVNLYFLNPVNGTTKIVVDVDNVGVKKITNEGEIRVQTDYTIYCKDFANTGTHVHEPGYYGDISVGGQPLELSPYDIRTKQDALYDDIVCGDL